MSGRAAASPTWSMSRRCRSVPSGICRHRPWVRRACDLRQCSLSGVVAHRMYSAVAPFADECFITPMAAVAGSVAEEILGAMLAAAPLDRAYVNNGGDIALP